MARPDDPPAASGDPLVSLPDLAGTPAADAEGRFFGEVYGSLADRDSGLIRYLDLNVHGAGRHVLVPIGHVRVARTGEKSSGIRLRAATADDLAAIPPYEPSSGAAGFDLDRPILDAHGRLFAGERYYAHPAFDHSTLYAGERPIVRRGEAGDRTGLAPLSELEDFELAEGEPDIKGWPLLVAGDREVGAVDELIADPEALDIRYVSVRAPSGRDVLLPIGFLEIDRERRALRAPALRPGELDSLPPRPSTLTRADEEAIRAALERVLDGARRYQRPDFRAPRLD